MDPAGGSEQCLACVWMAQREEPHEKMPHEKLQLWREFCTRPHSPQSESICSPAPHGSVSWALTQHSGEPAALDGSYQAPGPLESRCAGQRLTHSHRRGSIRTAGARGFVPSHTSRGHRVWWEGTLAESFAGCPGCSDRTETQVSRPGDDLCTGAELRRSSWWNSKCS